MTGTHAYLVAAKHQDDGGWAKHSQFHWSRYVNGVRVDYWPSKSKFSIKGVVSQGDVYAAIRALAEGRA